MSNNRIPLLCYVLLLVCLNRICDADPIVKTKSQAHELKAALQRHLKARDDFKLYISKLKNVESSTLLSTVTSHIEDAKGQLDATNPNSKCAQDAEASLNVLQVHANIVLQDFNSRISDITTPEDQIYHETVTNPNSKCVQDAENYLETLQTHANVIFRKNNPRISDLTTPEDQQYHELVGNELAAAVDNLIEACNQSDANSKCDSAALNVLTQREATLGRSLEPIRQANSLIRPLYNTLNGIKSQYQTCLSDTQ